MTNWERLQQEPNCCWHLSRQTGNAYCVHGVVVTAAQLRTISLQEAIMKAVGERHHGA